MRDQITRLCSKLVRARDTEQIRPMAEQLQDAIRERLDHIRDNAIGVAIVDRIVTVDALVHSPQREHELSARTCRLKVRK
jgi:hypothetical protein